MGEFRHRHTVNDHALGILHALFGVGVHRIEILNDKGQTVGEGKGSTEAGARAQAWKDVSRKDCG